MGRKLERHAERLRAGGRNAHFSSSTGRKALTFSREELASRGVEVMIHKRLHKTYNVAGENFCFKTFYLVRYPHINFLSCFAYIPLILFTN